MWSINNFCIFILLLLASVNYSISIALYDPRSQLSSPRSGCLISSLIPDFGSQNFFPEFDLNKILAGINLGLFLPGFLRPSKPSKPATPPVSGEVDIWGRPVIPPTIVFNDTLKNETCLKAINETEGNRYVILKYEKYSHLISDNDTDETYLEYVILKLPIFKSLRIPHNPPKKKRICVEFLGHASNMSYACSIIECFWDEEDLTTKPTVKPTVKPSGGYLVISKMRKQIVEQISKYVKF
uniref:Uncharacterized protein n=1 Tax=Strongyloides venezuelensis TaxID=75913 RepID=A0A0K0FCI9_STRVS